ncbi:MAG: ATP-binding cassette domain-containing protein [Elusimicrobia bacterium]|nr:ATP-binding cassette domain-containing protein [Elusimicrobiota bacterium]MBD3412505.1 ATP-binding cassette domain-containing protein [Elusimicrobiota bacterium]
MSKNLSSYPLKGERYAVICMNKILTVNTISKQYHVGSMWFPQHRKTITALHDVSFDLEEKKIIGIVGESGSGKTTLGKIIAGIEMPDRGSVLFNGKNLNSIPVRKRVKTIQMIFQDPYASMNPKLSLGFQLQEAIIQGNWEINLGRTEIHDKINFYLDQVGMKKNILEAYPHQLSGGELQRVTIARALAMQPQIIIADEPVSSLDLCIQAQILNLMKELQEQFSFSFIFISHDLAVINYMADNVLVFHNGSVVEQGSVSSILSNPENAYTRELIAAVPQVPT